MILAPARSEVAFWHGMDRLVGDLVLPPWAGPHPAVVVAHEPQSRDPRCSWQHRLAAAGLGSLAYDPAGTGRSTGDWRRQQVGDRASEILAAHDVLAGHPQVRGDALALVALGEAGWAAIRAQGFSGAFVGLVLLSVPVLDPVAVEQHRLGRRLERQGIGSDDVGLALAILRERFRRLADGADVAAVLAAEAACRPAAWYRLMPSLSPESVQLVTRIADVDPPAEVAAVGCPLLALHGAADLTLPVQRSIETMLRSLRAAGHQDHACVVVPDADHRLRGPGPDVAAGVHELVVTWLDRRLARAVQDAPRPASPLEPVAPPVTPEPLPEVHLPLTTVLPVLRRPTGP